MRLLLALAAAGAAWYYYRKRNGRYTGSTTNASDAVDDVSLPSHPGREQILDEGVKETFPASDPVAVGSAAGETAWERQQRGKRR